MREDIYFAAWKLTFQSQLTVLHTSLVNSLEIPLNPWEEDFTDFCLCVFKQCPELIDYHQN